MAMLPGVAKMKNQLAERNLDETRAQAADGDHRFDDAERAAQSGRAQGKPQAPHRRRLRHQARGHQPASENAPHHGRRDESHGRRQARADGGARQHARLGGGGMPSPEQMAKLAKKMPGGLPPGMPGAPACRRIAGLAAEFSRAAGRSETSGRPARPSGSGKQPREHISRHVFRFGDTKKSSPRMTLNLTKGN